MAIRFLCVCGKEYSVADEYAGKQVRCTDCNQVVVVPDIQPDQTPDPYGQQQPPSQPPPQQWMDERQRQPVNDGRPFSDNLPPPKYAHTNGNAIGAFVCGILSWTLCGVLSAIVGVILGHMALKEIRRSTGEKGAGLAIAGLVLCYIVIVLTVLLFLFIALVSVRV